MSAAKDGAPAGAAARGIRETQDTPTGAALFCSTEALTVISADDLTVLPVPGRRRDSGRCAAGSVSVPFSPRRQVDWVGGVPEPVFIDIANKRDTRAQRKAHLCLLITQRCNTVPTSVANGSIDIVRAWKAARERALKVCASQRSSVGDLEAALNSMARFK